MFLNPENSHYLISRHDPTPNTTLETHAKIKAYFQTLLLLLGHWGVEPLRRRDLSVDIVYIGVSHWYSSIVVHIGLIGASRCLFHAPRVHARVQGSRTNLQKLKLRVC